MYRIFFLHSWSWMNGIKRIEGALAVSLRAFLFGKYFPFCCTYSRIGILVSHPKHTNTKSHLFNTSCILNLSNMS